jgi:TonB family protein
MTTVWTLDAILRASLVLAVGLGVTAVLRHRRAALRHAILAGAIFGSAVVPAGRLLPAVTLPVPAISVSSGAAAQPGVSPRVIVLEHGSVGESSRVAPSGWTLVWLAGCLVMAALLAGDAIRLRHMASSARPLDDDRWRRHADQIRAAFGIKRAVPLLATATQDVLATSGLFRPRVLLPSGARGWSDERIRIVLAHELAHVRRGDWAVQMTAEIVRAFCWFNPLVWVACTRLRRDSEHACDDVVVGFGAQPADYAAHLLDIARTCRRPLRISTAMTMARPSTLHRRIAVMLNTKIDHRPLAPRRGAWIAALVVAAGISVIAVQAKQAGPAPLVGTIYDPTGAVLPGVTLTLRDSNGVEQKTTTNATGHFEFSAVAPGHYRLATAIPGFHTLDAQFDLKNAQDWDRPITLQVGTVQETITISAARTGVAPAAAIPGGQPVRVGGNIRAPRKLLDVRPVYPPEMQAAGREGVVPLEAVIRRDGTVGSVRVLSAEVHPDFAIAAADAVRQWRFSPTMLNGQAVEVLMNVSITFKLND